jgi:hypothetical protein
MSNDNKLLTKDIIIKAFERLSELLIINKLSADIYIVGGAATILLDYHTRENTEDVDATYPWQIDDYIIQIGNEMQLSPDWLNNAAKRFVPIEKDEKCISFLNTENLKISIASDEYLLAMKLTAGRDKDIIDIEFLLKKLNIKHIDECIDIVDKLCEWPRNTISENTKNIINNFLNKENNKNTTFTNIVKNDANINYDKNKNNI